MIEIEFFSVSNRDKREDSNSSAENRVYKKISLYKDVKISIFIFSIHQKILHQKKNMKKKIMILIIGEGNYSLHMINYFVMIFY